MDLLVNRDGTVRDVSVVSASGDPRAIDIAVAQARQLVFQARINPNDPAPYVVPNRRFTFKGESGPGQPVSYPYYESAY